MLAFTSGEFATSACRVIAPITIERPLTSIPESSPAIALRSMRLSGDASRSFIVGISVCPPARIFASSSLPSIFEAWRRPVGRWNSKLYIVVLLNSFRRLAGLCLLQCGPHRCRRGWHGDILRAERIGNRVDHRGGRCDRTRFAAAFDAERIGRAFGLGGIDLE